MWVVCVLWATEAIHIIANNRTDGPSLVNLAIFLTAFLLLENRAYALVNYKLGNPDWLYESYFPTFIAFQVSGIGVLNIAALIRYRQTMVSDPQRVDFNRLLSFSVRIGIVLAAVYLFLIIH